MEIFRIKNDGLSREQWFTILSTLRRGGVVVYPTDTAYGFAVDPRVRGAAAKIFAIKGRRDTKPLSAIVSSTAMAKRYGVFSVLARRLARKHWPGALMLVVPLRKTSIAKPLASLGSRTMVGLRFPDHPIAITLVKKMGYPITSTSANRSGKPPCYSVKEFLKQFGFQGSSPLDRARGKLSNVQGSTFLSSRSNLNRDSREVPLPDIFINAGVLPRRPTSTVVEVRGDFTRILRQGRIHITEHHRLIRAN